MGRLSLGDWLEAYVCFILTVEFVYDYLWNSREARLKRRRNEKAKKENKKAEVEQPVLREGTGAILPDSGREVRDLPKTTKPI